MSFHADHTHTFEPCRIIEQQARPLAQDSDVSDIQGHNQTLVTRQRQMMNDQTCQRPPHLRTRDLGTRIGRLAHVLTPHVSTLWAPVAARAHVLDRGTPPAGLMRQAPDYRVTRNAMAPTAPTPPVLTSNTERQHCMVRLNALDRHLLSQAIKAHERAQIKAIKSSTGHVEVYQMDGSEISIIERPRPLHGHETPPPYALKCEEREKQSRALALDSQNSYAHNYRSST